MWGTSVALAPFLVAYSRVDSQRTLVGPFTRAQALAAGGVTSRMLQGPGFVRVHPRVWKLAAHVMSDDDWVTAAILGVAGRGPADRYHPSPAARARLRSEATRPLRRPGRPAPSGGRDLPAPDQADAPR